MFQTLHAVRNPSFAPPHKNRVKEQVQCGTLRLTGLETNEMSICVLIITAATVAYLGGLFVRQELQRAFHDLGRLEN